MFNSVTLIILHSNFKKINLFDKISNYASVFQAAIGMSLVHQNSYIRKVLKGIKNNIYSKNTYGVSYH